MVSGRFLVVFSNSGSRSRTGCGEAQPTDEASEVRWMPREQAAELMTPAFAVRVLDAFQDGTAVRTHDGVDLLST